MCSVNNREVKKIVKTQQEESKALLVLQRLMSLSSPDTVIGPETPGHYHGLNLIMQIYKLWELWSKIKSKNSFFCALNLTHRLICVNVEWSD